MKSKRRLSRETRKGCTLEKLQKRDELLTIQQMARVTGLSAHTLRYYERAGLMIQSVGRDEANGYRYYTQQDVIWIEFLFADIALAVASVWFERLTSVESKKPSGLKLPPAVPDAEPDLPVRALPMRTLREGPLP